MIDTRQSLVAQYIENQNEGGSMKTKSNDILIQNKVFLWIALATGLILLVPLIAMQLSDEVVWSLLDFATAGALLFGTSLLFVLAARKVDKRYRVAIGIALMAALLYVWLELAVGIFTNWGS
jgi:hypothetical protein